jgi:hypothetical protein
MGIRHLTYLDLSPEQRKEGAKAAREQLRQAVANPFLSPEQQSALADRRDHIDKWEKGHLDPAHGLQLHGKPKTAALPGSAEPKGLLAAPLVVVEEAPPASEDVPLEGLFADDLPEPTHHVVQVIETVPIEEQVTGSAEKPKA